MFLTAVPGLMVPGLLEPGLPKLTGSPAPSVTGAVFWFGSPQLGWTTGPLT